MKFFVKAAVILILGCLSLLHGSCEILEPKIAVLWTDQEEFAVYAELFNNSQTQYKIETVFLPYPARKLSNTEVYPDLVVGSWLKSSSTRSLFRPLDHFFDDMYLKRSSFYSRLLDLGFIEDRQYLLPVAFNVPALIYSRDNQNLVEGSFTLNLDQIRTLGAAYNVIQNETYTRMGFSPRWDDEFLYICAVLFDTDFQEGSPLAWEVHALNQAVEYIRSWSREANGGIQAEDEFSFKYLYDPAPKLAASSRVLFAYINSSELFTTPEERRSLLDFRWIEKDGRIPLMERAPYLGVVKRGKAANAANAFVQWFYNEETQRKILEMSKDTRLNETSFGISNGFSSLKNVNEQIFPHFYPGLLGHVPPEDYLVPPNILPGDWIELKEKVVLPFLRDRAAASDIRETASLEKRISDWYRSNSSL